MTRKGLDWKREEKEQSEKDWEILGGIAPIGRFDVPKFERVASLPIGELQYGADDFTDCASRSPINILETQFNYAYKNNLLSQDEKQWLERNGYVVDGVFAFSDRFVAMNANTTRQGNSLKAPLEAIRKQGLIPKSHLPANSLMTWNDYHDKRDITTAMRKLGKEFARRFTVRYERVYATAFKHLLTKYMIDTGGYAWPQPVNGIYEKSDIPANHAFMVYMPEYFMFDNYKDSVDGDWIKQLSPDYNFLPYGYRVYVIDPTKATPWTQLTQFLQSLFS